MRRRLFPALLAALVVAACSRGPVPGGPPVRASGPASAPPAGVMEQVAARHPACGIVPLGEPRMSMVRLRDDTAVSLRLPAGFTPQDSAGGLGLQQWGDAATTLVMVGVSAGGKSSFDVDGTAHVDEGECSQRIADRLSVVRRSRLVLPTGTDTLYTADVNVAHQADRWIGAGVFARTAAAREQALAALATLRVDRR